MMDPKKQPLRFAVVEVTNRCNMACRHCASDSGRARSDELSRDAFEKLFASLAGLGCERVTMLGGEFLLREDWFALGKSIREHGMELQLITNGLLVDDAIADQFLMLSPQVVCVSLDGASPASFKALRGVDGFQKCLDTLSLFTRRPFRNVAAITTFSSGNLQEFPQFRELFLDQKIIWQIQMVNRGGDRFDDALLLSEEEYRQFVFYANETIEHYAGRILLQLTDDFGYFPISGKYPYLQGWTGCPAGREVIGIRSNGDVLGCLSLGNLFVADNLRHRSLEEIWADDSVFGILRRKEEHLTGACARCPHGKICRAGCSAMGESSSGGIGDNDYCLRKMEQKQFIQEFTQGL
ncbi:MAG: radical SAM protein [Victivallaceae bacterium]|nr:radical SAM protein [Victivallaceae bacterium]